MDIKTKSLERKIKTDLAKWNKLWHKVDCHGKAVTDKEINELAILDQYIADYRRQGKLEDISDKGLIGKALHKMQEVFTRRNMDVDTLKVSYQERPSLNRERYAQEGLDDDDLREMRLSYQGSSWIIGPLLHKIKDWNLSRKINKELALVDNIFKQYYQNQYDRSFNNRMTEICLENLAPQLTKRIELKEIINRNGKWKLGVGFLRVFILPIPYPTVKRAWTPVDERDISDLAELNILRKGIVEPDSKEEQSYFLNMYDDRYRDELKWRANELGIETANGTGAKIYDLQTYVDGVEAERERSSSERLKEEQPERVKASQPERQEVAVAGR